MNTPHDINNVVEFVDLTLGYERHPAVHHLNTKISRGDMLAIVGPNGGGKSTLLKSVVGQLQPLAGEVRLADQRVAFLPQLNAIDLGFPITVQDVVGTGLMCESGMFNAWSGDQQQRIEDTLHSVGMSDFRNKAIGALSGGQIQRVLFARALIQQASMILLDEPFSALDGSATEDLVSLLRDANEQGITVVAVLHDMRLVRRHFPLTMMLARELIVQGATSEVLVPHNILKCQHMPESFDELAQICRHNAHDSEFSKSA